MTTIIIRPKTHEKWLEIRKQGIGSSEIATIVGLNPFETPYELFRRKREVDPPKEPTFLMKAGNYLEDAITQFWQDETGRKVIKRSAIDWIIRKKEKPWEQVSPDRTYWLDAGRSPDNKGILECKSTQMTIDGDDLPKNWFCQLQYQLGVAGMTQGSLAWLTAGREFGYRDMKLVPEFYAWLAEEAEHFYKDSVLGGKEPTLINVRDILLKYNRHQDGKIIEVSAELYDDWSKLKEVRKELAELEEKKKALEDNLKMAFADAEAISYEGQTLATYKAPKASKVFDAKKFQADHPDLAEEYTYERENSRRFLLK